MSGKLRWFFLLALSCASVGLQADVWGDIKKTAKKGASSVKKTAKKGVKAVAGVGAFAIPGLVTMAIGMAADNIKDNEKIINKQASLEKVRAAAISMHDQLDRLFYTVRSDRALARKLSASFKRFDTPIQAKLDEMQAIIDTSKNTADYLKIPGLGKEAFELLKTADEI